ncbi:MAG: molybdopterin-binding/glycosyltransferase family 2 protein [Acetobacteraceae bacterium]|nr:molybdopterin-binding/glycosyltransferase family 2 protein [Acetobacteraceae bacterium]
MRFGPVPLAEASGAIIAHSHRLPDRVIRKGAVLDDAALAALRAAGIQQIVAARLDPGDVGENVCADRLAAMFVGPGLSRSPAATGRVNLIADAPGVLRVDAESVERVNGVDEAITVGTLPDYAVVRARDMVATIKIIPFAVPSNRLEAALGAAGRTGAPPLALHPFRPLRVGIVATELPGLKESAIAKAIEATEQRVLALTGTLLPARRCAHEEAAVARTLGELLQAGAEMLLVIGASAVVDRRDVGPAAIVRAGGEIVHFGMPVDPGNLICVGRIGSLPALVLPGCARSPRLNGIDFVLPRLFAALPLGSAEIVRMGVGGLLKEVDARPLPRARATATVAATGIAPRSAPRIAAVVLAAGRSSRMAPHNKLLLPDRTGKAMIARVVDNVLASRARPVLVVTGHQAELVQQALSGRPVQLVEAPDYAQGLSASLKAGIAAVPAECDAALICLGDMPLVAGRVLDRLLAAFDREEGRLIVLPTFRGKAGNPMLWGRPFFPDILSLSGDSGARTLAARHAEAVAEVEVGEDAVLRDFDTVEALATLPERFRIDAPDAALPRPAAPRLRPSAEPVTAPSSPHADG